MMEPNDELNVARSQQEWSRFVADNALSYIEKREFDLLKSAQKYIAALAACEFLGLPSPAAAKAWTAGTEFSEEFEAYKMRREAVR
jgi:hypothetical protein